MKIAFFSGGMGDGEKSIAAAFPGDTIDFFAEKLDESNVSLAKDADVLSVFVNSTVNKAVIDAIPNLKFISTRSMGFDHIDCEYAKSKGIRVSNVPAYGSYTVAEFAFALLLDMSRKITLATNYVKQTDYNYTPSMCGFDLHGKTLGVIGVGKIGKSSIKIAKGFGMNILAADIYPDPVFAKENNFEYSPLEKVIKESDIITLHTPYSKENHYLLGSEEIAMMKKGVYIVNTARGELVDTTALLAALKDGTVAGFCADVVEKDRKFKDEKNFLAKGGILTEDEKRIFALNHELISLPNVIITPHSAFFSAEAVAEILKVNTGNIQGFVSGNLVNLVN